MQELAEMPARTLLNAGSLSRERDTSILLCVGTRPEVIKMAPVYHALSAAGLNPIVLHTGQHEAGADPDRPTGHSMSFSGSSRPTGSI